MKIKQQKNGDKREREGDVWRENMKSSTTFVREVGRRRVAVLWARECEELNHLCQNTMSFRSTFFLNFQFLKIKKKRGKWVGKIELPHVAYFHWSKNEAPEDDPKRIEGDGCMRSRRMI